MNGITTQALQELYYQFEELGNYVKGVELAARAFKQLPTDRFLHRRLETYLLQILTQPRVPYLPPLSKCGFPPSVLRNLRSIKVRPRETIKSEVGAVLCLLIDQRNSGLVRLFRIGRSQPSKVTTFSWGTTENMKGYIVRACRDAGKYLASTYGVYSSGDPTSGYAFEIVGWNPSMKGQSTDGPSIQCAAALAFISLCTDVPLASDIAVTGELEGLKLKKVGGVEQKIEAVVREHPYVKRILIPRDNLADLDSSLRDKVTAMEDLPSILKHLFDGRFAELIVQPEESIPEIRAAVDREYAEGNYRSARERLRGLLHRFSSSKVHPKDHFFYSWRMASIASHWGDIAEAEKQFTQALKLADVLWRGPRISTEDYLGVHVSYAVHLTDIYQYEKAEQSLCDNPVCRSGQRRQTLAEVRRLGTLGQIYRLSKRFSEAERAFVKALRLIDPDAEKGELPREHTYIGTLYTDTGDYSKAEEHFKTAEKINASLENASLRALDELFIRTHASRLFHLEGKYRLSIAEAEKAIELCTGYERIFPGCLARRYQAASLIAIGEVERGRSILRAEMERLPDAIDWKSPNIRVIRDASVVELVLNLLNKKGFSQGEIRFLLRHILTGLEDFHAAVHFFKSDIAKLRNHLRQKQILPSLRKDLQVLAQKIHT